ncbi:MAG: hypothetical protein ACLUYK_02105 [Eggerthella lenta]
MQTRLARIGHLRDAITGAFDEATAAALAGSSCLGAPASEG